MQLKHRHRIAGADQARSFSGVSGVAASAAASRGIVSAMPLLQCNFLAILASTTWSLAAISAVGASIGRLAWRSCWETQPKVLGAGCAAERQEAARPRRGLVFGPVGGRRCPRGWGKPRNGPGTGLLVWISDLFPTQTYLKPVSLFNELAGGKWLTERKRFCPFAPREAHGAVG